MKAKYQDNLEFLQWMKRYFDINYNGEPYDAVGRRKGQNLYYIGIGNKPQPKGTAAARAGGAKKPSYKSAAPSLGVKRSAPSGGAGAASGASSAKVKELEGELAELRLTSDTLEKERDFYFTKLRDVEILCQRPEHASTPLGIAVAQILYAMDEQSAQDVLDGKAPAEPEAHPVDVTATDAEAEEAKPDVAATEDDVPTSVTKMGLVRLDSSSSSFGKSPLVSGTPLAARSPLAGLENRAQASPMC